MPNFFKKKLIQLIQIDKNRAVLSIGHDVKIDEPSLPLPNAKF